MRLVQRIVPDSSNHQPLQPTTPPTLILHTNGAGHSVASLHDYIINSKTRIYPHIQVAWDGSIEQYCPFDRQAYVQYDGNRYAISAETQDSGYQVKPIDRDPWSDAQLHAFADLAIMLKVPAKACTGPTSGGIGYHSQFRDAWNKDGHNCPGFARRDQIPKVLEYMTTVGSAEVPKPPAPPQEAEDVPYLMVQPAGYQNIFALFANGSARQMALAEFLWLKSKGVEMVTETTDAGLDLLLDLSNLDHSALVKV